jgi:high-affinity nickel permease
MPEEADPPVVMPESQFVTLLVVGFLLGARHALDADHLVAVSTLLSRHPNLRISGLIGFCWGLGHTAMLLVVGALVLLLHVAIPDQLALFMEFGVGLLLVWLGVSLAATILREHWHLHHHHHDGEAHVHLHSHMQRSPSGMPSLADHDHPHWLTVSLRPVLVGMAHGLAGSAAVMLLVVSTVPSVTRGLLYVTVFGLGSILGMMGVGLVISLPFVLSGSWNQRVQLATQGVASLGSIGLGLTMIVRLGLGQPLF